MSRAQRRAIAEEAARLMMDEDIKEYIHAKRTAADNLLGMRFGSRISLPSNGEVRAAIVARAALVDGSAHGRRLVHMRTVALSVMRQLAAFQPRLIGSVATGTIHARSDIDIQLFCLRQDRLEQVLWAEGYDAERLEHEVFKDGVTTLYVHFHFDVAGVPVELSVYEPPELHIVRYSSVDGRPIDRMPMGRLQALL